MDRKVYVSLLILLGVALALAGQAAGDMKASFAGAGAYSIDAAVRQLLSASKLEEGVAPELTVDLEVHRRILAGNISPGALQRNKPACIGSCPARGRQYTGRGCNSHYQCQWVATPATYLLYSRRWMHARSIDASLAFAFQ